MSLSFHRMLVFATSACVLILEIVAGRLMAPYLGVSLETFSGIIGTVLAAIAVGAWAGGSAADRVPPGRLLGPMIASAGALVLAAPTLVDLFGPLVRGAGMFGIVALTSIAFFLPIAALSTVPPLVVKLRLRSLHETGAVVGSLSAIGTVGAIAGTFATGFFFLSAFPTRPLLIGLGLLLLSGGALMSAKGRRSRAGLLALLIPTVVLAQANLGRGPCQFETAYFCAQIETRPGFPDRKALRLDTLRHSFVDLGDPGYLEFRYTRAMADVLASEPPGPLRVGYIGGGGFTLPRYVEFVRPGSSGTVFEIDAPLVALAERELGFRKTPALEVVIGDARLELPRLPRGSFDVVIGDAFSGLSVPWHLTTQEFLQLVDGALTEDGLYVMNLIDYPPLRFARAEVRTLQEVFPHVAVIALERQLNGGEGGNYVVVGARHPLALESIKSRLSARRESEDIWSGREASLFAADAPTLRDDFAPVDQLIGGRPR